MPSSGLHGHCKHMVLTRAGKNKKNFIDKKFSKNIVLTLESFRLEVTHGKINNGNEFYRHKIIMLLYLRLRLPQIHILTIKWTKKLKTIAYLFSSKLHHFISSIGACIH